LAGARLSKKSAGFMGELWFKNSAVQKQSSRLRESDARRTQLLE